jgi:hypothetical protein
MDAHRQYRIDVVEMVCFLTCLPFFRARPPPATPTFDLFQAA